MAHKYTRYPNSIEYMGEYFNNFKQGARPFLKWGLIFTVILIIAVSIWVLGANRKDNGFNKMLVFVIGVYVIGMSLFLTFLTASLAGLYNAGGILHMTAGAFLVPPALSALISVLL